MSGTKPKVRKPAVGTALVTTDTRYQNHAPPLIASLAPPPPRRPLSPPPPSQADLFNNGKPVPLKVFHPLQTSPPYVKINKGLKISFRSQTGLLFDAYLRTRPPAAQLPSPPGPPELEEMVKLSMDSPNQWVQFDRPRADSPIIKFKNVELVTVSDMETVEL